MQENDPLLKKPITSELGNVSPVVIVPGLPGTPGASPEIAPSATVKADCGCSTLSVMRSSVAPRTGRIVQPGGGVSKLSTVICDGNSIRTRVVGMVRSDGTRTVNSTRSFGARSRISG